MPRASDAAGVAGRREGPSPVGRYGRSAVPAPVKPRSSATLGVVGRLGQHRLPGGTSVRRCRCRARRRARGAGARLCPCHGRCPPRLCHPYRLMRGRPTRGKAPCRERRCRRRTVGASVRRVPRPPPTRWARPGRRGAYLRRGPGRRTPGVGDDTARVGGSLVPGRRSRVVQRGPGSKGPGLPEVRGRGVGAGEGGAARFRAHAPPFPRARAGPRVRGRRVAARWPGADASRAQIPARPARHPPGRPGGHVPPCVRVTLRRAARRTGTGPQARGICPERPPTLR